MHMYKEREKRAGGIKPHPFALTFVAFCGAFAARPTLPSRSAAQFQVNGRIANSVSLG